MPAELLRVDAQSPQVEVLRYAAHFLTRGHVVAIPTDTFYGLAADPFNLAAVDEIYRVKGRPETRALPILVNCLEQALMLVRDCEEGDPGLGITPRKGGAALAEERGCGAVDRRVWGADYRRKRERIGISVMLWRGSGDEAVGEPPAAGAGRRRYRSVVAVDDR